MRGDYLAHRNTSEEFPVIHAVWGSTKPAARTGGARRGYATHIASLDTIDIFRELF